MAQKPILSSTCCYKVLLEHFPAHLFMFCLWLLLHYRARAEWLQQRPYGPLYYKKFANPWSIPRISPLLILCSKILNNHSRFSRLHAEMAFGATSNMPQRWQKGRECVNSQQRYQVQNTSLILASPCPTRSPTQPDSLVTTALKQTPWQGPEPWGNNRWRKLICS